jgi:serine/threonine protein kinase
MSKSRCPNSAVLRDFVAGALDEWAAAEVAEHVQSCEICRAAIVTLRDAGQLEFTQPAGEHLASTQRVPNDGEAADEGLSQLMATFLCPSPNPRAIGRLDEHDLLDLIGHGGMGVVFRAWDESLQRHVAIKVLSPQLAASQKARRRFLREARAAAAINHPNVVTIHAVSEQKGIPFLVMEYIAGGSLRERIHASPPLDVVDILRISAQVAAGLHAAHEQGVIHRDIKPANIMLEGGVDRVKITDFGLARAVMDLSEITSQGRTVGTPAYMSPEQVQGDPVDSRSDLFSLGCVMYAMFTGHSPFTSANSLDVIRRVCDLQPEPLGDVVPRQVSQFIMRLLSKDAAKRGSTAEVADTLRRLLAVVNQTQSNQVPQFGGIGVQRSRSWLGWSLGASLFVLVVSLGFVVLPWVQSRTGGRSPSSSNGDGPTAAAPPSASPPLHDGPVPAEGRIAGEITVSQTGAARFQDLSRALAHAAPGATIRILDDAVYQGPWEIADAKRFTGLTIESTREATLATGQGTVLRIVDTPRVTLRGLRFEAATDQHALWIMGNAEAVTIEDVVFRQPAASQFAAVVLSHARGTAERPIRLSRLRVACGFVGIALLGSTGQAVTGVRVEDCRFEAPTGHGVQLTLEKAVRDVRISRCVFTGGAGGIYLSLQQPSHSRNLRIQNNTFFEVANWIGFTDSSLEQEDCLIRDNLILQCQGIQLSNQDTATLTARWMRNNWWEPGGGSDEAQVRVVNGARPMTAPLPMLSRERANADFLRPAADSELATGGSGGESPAFVGAIAPAPAKADQ